MTTKLVGTGTMKYDDSAFYSKCDNMTIIIASLILHTTCTHLSPEYMSDFHEVIVHYVG